MTYVNISAYKFIKLTDLTSLQKQLKEYCVVSEVKGTILLSEEGININLAGSDQATKHFINSLHKDSRFADIIFKFSLSEKSAFKRIYVKIKPEIITTGIKNLNPILDPQYRISPKELKKWLDEEKDFLLLDTRNNYETQIGTFSKAVTLNIEEFSGFFPKIRELPEETKAKPVVMFCTGGVRCEKALPQMLAAGFTEVYQLEGGILNYFMECKDAHYEGECFVFDERVGVTADSILEEK